MTKWWNDDDQLEQNLLDWFSNEDLSSWLTCTYEIFVGSSDVKCVNFTLKDGLCSWNIHYSDGWCYPAGEHVVLGYNDILAGFKRIIGNPLKYRQ